MNESSEKRKGVVDWLSLILPTAIVLIGGLVGYYGGYSKLEQRVTSSCEKFQEDLHRLETSGTAVSVSNSKDIVGLQVKFETIDQRLKRIEDGQIQLINMLSRRSDNNP